MATGVFMKTSESLENFVVGTFMTSYDSTYGNIGETLKKRVLSLAFLDFEQTGGVI
jgi:hypothetical protein